MLDAGAIERLCLSFPGVELSIQWGGQRVFKIGGRMFATIGSREPHRVSFKCNEIAFHTLTEGPGVIPAPYLARARWVRLEDPSVMSDADLEGYLHRAYDLILAKLPRAERARIASL